MAGVAFAYRLRLTASSAGTVLMGLYIGTVDEHSLKVRLLEQSVENVEPLARRRPDVEAFVDQIPAPEGFGQISPETTHAHPVEHASTVNRRSGLW